jgi:hypothetical protein
MNLFFIKPVNIFLILQQKEENKIKYFELFSNHEYYLKTWDFSNQWTFFDYVNNIPTSSTIFQTKLTNLKYKRFFFSDPWTYFSKTFMWKPKLRPSCENLSSIESRRRWRTCHYVLEGVALEALSDLFMAVGQGGS